MRHWRYPALVAGINSNTIAVIGGLGPETGCAFTLSVNNKFKPIKKQQPHIILDSLPITADAETRLINGKPSHEHLRLLQESVQRLNTLKPLCIVIACNTVHIFIDTLRKSSATPILSIIEETANVCRQKKFQTVAILGSAMTIQSKLHTNALGTNNIQTIIPSKQHQQFINDCILRIINHTVRINDKFKLTQIIASMKKQGAEAVILGCTDLPLLISDKDSPLPVLNTTDILEDAAIARLSVNRTINGD